MVAIGQKIFYFLSRLIALLVFIDVLALSGATLWFALTQAFLTPADQNHLWDDVEPNLEVTSADVGRAVEGLSEATRAHPRMGEERLAELYEKGESVPRDIVIAAVLVWRTEHDNYFGLCTAGCDDSHLIALKSQISSEISAGQRKEAREVERLLYPNVVRNYQIADLTAGTLSIIVIASIGAAGWNIFRPRPAGPRR
jgi:hypothetical protein